MKVLFILLLILSCSPKTSTVPEELRRELSGFSELMKELETLSYVRTYSYSHSDPFEEALSYMASGIWTRYGQALENIHLVPEERRPEFYMRIVRAYENFDRREILKLLEEYRKLKKKEERKNPLEELGIARPLPEEP